MVKNSLLTTALLCGFFGAGFAQTKSGPPVLTPTRSVPFRVLHLPRMERRKPTPIRAASKDSAPIAFRLKPVRRFRHDRRGYNNPAGNSPRSKKYDARGNENQKGEQFYVLTNLGEGFAKVWSRPRFSGRTLRRFQLQIIREPKSICG